jgi:hypothetical protein
MDVSKDDEIFFQTFSQDEMHVHPGIWAYVMQIFGTSYRLTHTTKFFYVYLLSSW